MTIESIPKFTGPTDKLWAVIGLDVICQLLQAVRSVRKRIGTQNKCHLVCLLRQG